MTSHAPTSHHPVETLSPRERRRQALLLILAGFFIGNALLAELIGGKLFEINTHVDVLSRGEPYVIAMSCGIVLWPLVFIITDILNEYFGRSGVRRITFLAAGVIAYAFIALTFADMIKAPEWSPIKSDAFENVFMQSRFMIVGSIMAFLLAQLVDVAVFWIIRRQTGHRHLWLRATGSTIISQIIDTYIVGFIGLFLPYWLSQNYPSAFGAAGGLPFGKFLEVQTAGYAFKLVVAIGITPILYLVHGLIDSYLGREQAHSMIETAAKPEGADDATVAAKP